MRNRSFLMFFCAKSHYVCLIYHRKVGLKEKNRIFVLDNLAGVMKRTVVLCSVLVLVMTAFSQNHPASYFADGFHGGVYGHYPLDSATDYRMPQEHVLPALVWGSQVMKLTCKAMRWPARHTTTIVSPYRCPVSASAPIA